MIFDGTYVNQFFERGRIVLKVYCFVIPNRCTYAAEVLGEADDKLGLLLVHILEVQFAVAVLCPNRPAYGTGKCTNGVSTLVSSARYQCNQYKTN